MREIKSKKPRAVICGAYGMGNAGDEAILEGIVGELRSEIPGVEITVFTRDGAETGNRLNVNCVHPFSPFGVLGALIKSHLLVSGGGNLIQDVTSSRSLFYYLAVIRLAHMFGCRVIMYGCGVGPVNSLRNRRIAARTINRCVDAVTLRESDSLRELRSWGVTRPGIALSADPALMLSPASENETDALLRRFGIEPETPCIAFCLRRWPGFLEKMPCFAEAADYAYTRYGLYPVFLSVNHKNDSDAARPAMSAMQAPASLIEEPLPTALTVGVLSRMQAVVSMRLHGLIFAAARGVPVVGVSYDPKVDAFLNALGEQAPVRLSDVTAEILKAGIDRALSEDRSRLLELAGGLRETEAVSKKKAAELIKKERK